MSTVDKNNHKETKISFIKVGLSLFLSGAVLAGAPICQTEILLFPALLSEKLKSVTMAGAWTGVLLGFFAGQMIARKRIPHRLLKLATALIPAVCIGLAGLFLNGTPSSLEQWSAWGGSDVSIRFIATPFFFSVSLFIPFLLGMSAMILIKEAACFARDEFLLVFLALGAATGALIFPLLLFRLLSLQGCLQILTMLIIANMVIHPEVKGTDSQVGNEPSGKPGFLSISVRAVILSFSITVIYNLLSSRLENCILETYLNDGIMVGFTLVGLALGLLIRVRMDAIRQVSFTPILLTSALLLVSLVDEKAPYSMAQDLNRAGFSCAFFGVIIGLILKTNIHAILKQGALGIIVGIGIAVLTIMAGMTLHIPAAVIAMIGTLPLLKKDLSSETNSAKSNRIKPLVFRTGACLAILAVSFSICPAFWFNINDKVGDLSSLENSQSNESTLFKHSGRSQHRRAAILSTFFHHQPEDLLVLGPGSATINELLNDPHIKTITWIRNLNDKDSSLGEHPEHTPKSQSSFKALRLPPRLYTRHSSRHFDLILLPLSSAPKLISHPLTSSTFYIEAENRLKKNGIFCQWINPHRMDHVTFTNILNSIRNVFSEVHIFTDHRRSSHPALALIGVKNKITLNVKDIRKRMTKLGCIEDFTALGLAPEKLAVNYLTSGSILGLRFPPSDDKAVVNAYLSWPADAVNNVKYNLTFLINLQALSLPFFELYTDEPSKRRKHVQRLLNTGKTLHGATLDRILRKGFGNDHDLTAAKGIDLIEASHLSQLCPPGIKYTYVQKLLDEKGKQLISDNDIKSAFTYYKSLFKRSPHITEIRLGLAWLWASQGEYQKAVKVVETPKGADWSDRSLVETLAVLKARLGYVTEAGLLLTSLTPTYTEQDFDIPWVLAAGKILFGNTPGEFSYFAGLPEDSAPPILRQFILEHASR